MSKDFVSNSIMNELFPTNFQSIKDRLKQIKPISYCDNRNYIDGDVSQLSPYISRGVISTRQVFKECLSVGFDLIEIEKFIQELAWRDYWQRVWQEKNIDDSLKKEQEEVMHFNLPSSILEAKTGINAVDNAILKFYETGYLHNHLRMYIASITTNIGRAQWKLPAQWMYFHLLDADWASNALSWQWVCGANSNKKYYANQENINRFCKDSQTGTFLDKTYEELLLMNVPKELRITAEFSLQTHLPKSEVFQLEKTPTLLYTWYNLDPEWRKEELANRVLILEPSHFKKYPISEMSMNFMLGLSKNISGLQIYVGEFSAFKSEFPNAKFVFKEHPTNKHFEGIEDQRDWLSSVKGYYPSFFGFWKKVRKEIIA
jgi:deoxyribodipyrimidine photo-lyase